MFATALIAAWAGATLWSLALGLYYRRNADAEERVVSRHLIESAGLSVGGAGLIVALPIAIVAAAVS